jgi:hypothetical protein
VVAYDLEGKDEEKLVFLQKAVRDDSARAKRCPVPSRYLTIDATIGHHTAALSYSFCLALSEMGRHLEMFNACPWKSQHRN